jgi:hypothetical protein
MLYSTVGAFGSWARKQKRTTFFVEEHSYMHKKVMKIGDNIPYKGSHMKF